MKSSLAVDKWKNKYLLMEQPGKVCLYSPHILFMLQDSYSWGNLCWFVLKVDFFKCLQETAQYDESGSMLLISEGIVAAIFTRDV